ncbi:hypothetical protein pRL70102 (plasmid) [Rhizobium johnstonii 3841]|uniref:Uncharacterized protein n=1 Tax=Rhizobium johnstonii (strain DSM 114642 / LMG 32736 / 3841) TaxID=216596 RepID=Q1M9S6_RHIJ3|nr:hypothetical protein pRL70102 [Rhizobium johnstonii 3841]
MIISRAASLQRSASACREPRGECFGQCVPERRKPPQNQGVGRCKPADRSVKDTAYRQESPSRPVQVLRQGSILPNAIHRFD